MAKTEARVIISLACTECKERTYSTSKNKRKTTERLELNKVLPPRPLARASPQLREAK